MKKNIQKIAFIGNGCTGKTTCAFETVKKLKLKKQRVGYCNDLCRSVPFNPEKFDTDPNARLHVLYKQMAAECEHMVRDDVDFLVTERTVLDWWLYYLWTCKNVSVKPDKLVADMVADWKKSYDIIFFMSTEGIDYVNDGFRPKSVDLRDQMDSLYNDLYKTLKSSGMTDLYLIKDREVVARVDKVSSMIGTMF